jgi:hypothetical protein
LARLIASSGRRGGRSTGSQRTRLGATALAARIIDLCDTGSAAVARRAELASVWLKERIDLALAARRLVGEHVTPAENARDQLLAFATHVVRRRPDLVGPWIGGSPTLDLEQAMPELEDIMATLDPDGVST